MSGSFSKQSSNQGSSAQSSQFGEQASSSFGQSGSTSTSNSLGASSTQQSIAFSDLFQQLYGGATAAALGVNTGGISGAADRLFSGGLQFLDQLQNGGSGLNALQSRATDTTARDAQLGALGANLGDFFNTQLLPGIRGQGVSSGTLGGSRQAVAESLAAKAVGSQYAQGAAQIYSADQAQRDQAAAQLAQLQTTNAQSGLGALGSLFGLAQGGASAALSPYQALASILGGPTVLSQSQSSQVSDALSQAFGLQGSQSYGFNQGNSSASSFGNSAGFGISGGIL